MRIEIADGFLTTVLPESPEGEPMFVRDGETFRSADVVDMGEAILPTSRYPSACDLVADGYARAVDAGHRFTRAEYNVIARFAGLPSMNPCSGE